MPCGDITERIVIHLDEDDQLTGYRLTKQTCGTPIGSESLLLPWLAHQSVETILCHTSDALRASFAEIPEDMEFLYSKHLTALQSALRTLCGREPSPEEPPCTALTITAEPDAVVFEGLVRIAERHAKIKSCGGCGGCDRRKGKTSVTGT